MLHFSVLPRERLNFSGLSQKERCKARRTEMRLIIFQIQNRFPRTKLVDLRGEAALVLLPNKNQARRIAREFNCKLSLINGGDKPPEEETLAT